jgi:hypothetical protein
MSIDTTPNGIPPDLIAEIQAAADWAAAGIRDTQVMRTASADMDRIREDIRRQHGVLDIGGPAVRELRDGRGTGQ